MKFAHKLADGPTVAHGATKKIIRGFRAGGVNQADEVTPGVFADLFASEDLKNAWRASSPTGRQGDIRGALTEHTLRHRP